MSKHVKFNDGEAIIHTDFNRLQKELESQSALYKESFLADQEDYGYSPVLLGGAHVEETSAGNFDVRPGTFLLPNYELVSPGVYGYISGESRVRPYAFSTQSFAPGTPPSTQFRRCLVKATVTRTDTDNTTTDFKDQTTGALSSQNFDKSVQYGISFSLVTSDHATELDALLDNPAPALVGTRFGALEYTSTYGTWIVANVVLDDSGSIVNVQEYHTPYGTSEYISGIGDVYFASSIQLPGDFNLSAVNGLIEYTGAGTGNMYIDSPLSAESSKGKKLVGAEVFVAGASGCVLQIHRNMPGLSGTTTSLATVAGPVALGGLGSVNPFVISFTGESFRGYPGAYSPSPLTSGYYSHGTQNRSHDPTTEATGRIRMLIQLTGSGSEFAWVKWIYRG